MIFALFRFSFSLPRLNSDQGSLKQALPPPPRLPHYGTSHQFISWEDSSCIIPRRDSHRICRKSDEKTKIAKEKSPINVLDTRKKITNTTTKTKPQPPTTTTKNKSTPHKRMRSISHPEGCWQGCASCLAFCRAPLAGRFGGPHWRRHGAGGGTGSVPESVSRAPSSRPPVTIANVGKKKK